LRLAKRGQVDGLSSGEWYNPGSWGKEAKFKQQLAAEAKSGTGESSVELNAKGMLTAEQQPAPKA